MSLVPPPPADIPAPQHEPDVDPTALSYWFPLIEAAGLPVPRTKIFKMPREAQEDIFSGFDGKGTAANLRAFAEHVAAESADLGFPLFLRTDHTSGKHDWSRTCFVPSADKIAGHMFGIAEFSELAGGIMGMPWSTWVAREMLPTKPICVCPDYGDMPVCREFRFFVDGASIKCVHPYWPRHALEKGGAAVTDAQYDALCNADDHDRLYALASAAGEAVGGAWSVDMLDTERGWFITDMAEASKSFHWKGCANEKAFPR